MAAQNKCAELRLRAERKRVRHAIRVVVLVSTQGLRRVRDQLLGGAGLDKCPESFVDGDQKLAHGYPAQEVVVADRLSVR